MRFCSGSATVPAAAEFIALDGQLAGAWSIRDDHRRAIEAADRFHQAAEGLDLIGVVSDTLVTKSAGSGRLQEWMS